MTIHKQFQEHFVLFYSKFVHLFKKIMDKTPDNGYNSDKQHHKGKSMNTTFDVESLNVFCKNFYTAIGIRLSVFDNAFNLITEYPIDAPEYCKLIRRTESGTQGCRKCDINAFEEAKKRRGLYVYTCHAGLTEAVTPIKFNDSILGYVILAHMLPKENLEESIKTALKKAQHYGLLEHEALNAIKKIPTISHEKINASAQILDAIASYLHISNWIRWNNEDLAVRISQYIDSHLDKNLTSDSLCKVFFISRTKLHSISINNYDLSISKYILSKRISKAKQLLKQDYTLEKIAELTGFANASYFGKVFKKETGLTPIKYKLS